MRLDAALPAKYSEKNRVVTPPDFKPTCSSVSQSQLKADKYAATKKVTTRHAKEASMQKERIEKRFINGQFSSRITATFTGPRHTSLFPKTARPAAPWATYCYPTQLFVFNIAAFRERVN